jgi:outer membrane protein OmpA-like peptidoglycan-associated protein
MKRLQRYEEFHNNQVQEGIKDYLLGGLATIGSMTTTPQTSMGQTKTPTEVVTSQQPTGKDILGRPLTGPPSTKTENLSKGKKLICTKQVNPSDEQIEAMKKRGWTVVWTEGGENQPKWGLKSGERKPGVEFKTDNDKFFELGGYTLTPEIKEKIKGQVQEMGGVDSVTIESSTDKTRLTPRLKADLESKGYSGDNQGLSKARSNAIRQFLTSLGINPDNIRETNLAEQGKEGGYDPSARYVKLTLTEKGTETDGGYEYFEVDEKTVWLQKVVGGIQKKPKPGDMGIGIDCEGGACPTYD